ncbi:MAG: efflux RND transporter periplasmic adaptor subunit [Pirellulaceae bacterium]|nr:efflux RND transporter periplasmic adaptor subunit [Pirellulaceae bacterium]
MNFIPNPLRRQWKVLATALAFLTATIAAVWTHELWRPVADRLPVEMHLKRTDEHESDATAELHAGHEDGGRAESTSRLQLSEQARKNVGLTLFTVQPRDFQRTVVVPAVVAERPGRSQLTVSAPMTGTVTRIYPISGEAVAPGDPLFDLRLTHEDVVEKQTSLLRDLEQRDIIQAEVDRLEEVSSSGAVAGKTRLEKIYQRQTIDASIRAEREALLLHGLTEEQIAFIETERRLVRQILISTPEPDVSHSSADHEDFLQVGKLTIQRGDHVVTGAPMAILTDHCELYIEGMAFEQDAHALENAARQRLPISAWIESNGDGTQELSNLHVLYIQSEVDRESRALRFYVSLPNVLSRKETTPDGHRFIAWRYRPGQRVEVMVPVELWTNRVVVPVDAVVKEGAEWFIFQQNGEYFERKPIHVEYRDQRWAVIENDGALFPGDVVAATGAFQMNLAMKNKAGGGVDPHAGHNH